jgi:hypothetical protein
MQGICSPSVRGWSAEVAAAGEVQYARDIAAHLVWKATKGN